MKTPDKDTSRFIDGLVSRYLERNCQPVLDRVARVIIAYEASPKALRNKEWLDAAHAAFHHCRSVARRAVIASLK